MGAALDSANKGRRRRRDMAVSSVAEESFRLFAGKQHPNARVRSHRLRYRLTFGFAGTLIPSFSGTGRPPGRMGPARALLCPPDGRWRITQIYQLLRARKVLPQAFRSRSLNRRLEWRVPHFRVRIVEKETEVFS